MFNIEIYKKDYEYHKHIVSIFIKRNIVLKVFMFKLFANNNNYLKRLLWSI